MIGFDFAVISSASKLDLASSQAARNNLHMRLKEREKKQFCRRGKTGKQNQFTCSGGEICQLTNNNIMTFISATMPPCGHTRPLLNRVLYGSDRKPHPTFRNKPHAQEYERIARSPSVPHGILSRANHLWKLNNPTTSYGGTYKATDPQSHSNQDFGLTMSTAVSSRLLRAYNKISNLKSSPCNENKQCRCDQDNSECACGTSAPCNTPFSRTNNNLYHQSQTPCAEQHKTERTPSQDTFLEHFGFGGRHHSCVTAGSNQWLKYIYPCPLTPPRAQQTSIMATSGNT
jgi:hypothetical protein